MFNFLPQLDAIRRIPSTILFVAALISAGTIAFYVHSYWWSESLTLCDATIRSDEGLMTLQLPLVRIAANQSPEYEFLLYKRDPKVWTAGKAGHTPLRSWMSYIDQQNKEWVEMFADFGYWKGGWQSNSRPGPFIVLIVPVWLLGVSLFGIYLAFHFKIVRFRLQDLLLAMTLLVIAVFVLTLEQNGSAN